MSTRFAALLLLTVTACDRAEPVYVPHCETEEDRARMIELATDCAAGSNWARQVRECEGMAMRAACPSVPGFRDYRTHRERPCSEAATDAQREACSIGPE